MTSDTNTSNHHAMRASNEWKATSMLSAPVATLAKTTMTRLLLVLFAIAILSASALEPPATISGADLLQAAHLTAEEIEKAVVSDGEECGDCGYCPARAALIFMGVCTAIVFTVFCGAATWVGYHATRCYLQWKAAGRLCGVSPT